MRNAGQLGLAALAFCLALTASDPASAITFDQLRDECRMSAGRPIFRTCMRVTGGHPHVCRAAARPAVWHCIRGRSSSAGISKAELQMRAERFQLWCQGRIRPYRNPHAFRLREARGCFTISLR